MCSRDFCTMDLSGCLSNTCTPWAQGFMITVLWDHSNGLQSTADRGSEPAPSFCMPVELSHKAQVAHAQTQGLY